MLSLNPGCICDVCAEEYGPRNLPHSITCGHVLCLGCCEKIISKTSPRLSPACPFCRESFTRENVRVIRIDFGTPTGHGTPKRIPLEAPDILTDIFSRKDHLKFTEPLITSRSREDVRKLELKVARVAAQKSSVEEVSMLHQELQAWLAAEPKGETQNTALQLSAALLRAILVNHVSHSEANKQSRSLELSMKEKFDEMEASHNKLEAELRSMRTQYSQKSQECQSLKADLARFKSSLAPAFTSASSVASSPLRPRSAMSVASSPTSPTPSNPSSPTYAPTHQSPLSRSAASSRSSSVTRSATPSPPSTRPNSPPAMIGRSPPPKMLRSQSADEKEERVHQRWIPTIATHDLMAKTRSSSLASSIKRPATAQSSAPPHRYGTPVSR
ncbi:hypothetical protein BJ322DRAFT_1001565 [Thelephora terrestris]|uniref:RING-type domain-containing protein n=1 Tax=Thelephora terrestris TaxID=56493 RepID=A0A9P6L9H9_9AGAM|nr:hypothetical protein BJ322DRAFT_1001565 [Thelephora terrestris]